MVTAKLVPWLLIGISFLHTTSNKHFCLTLYSAVKVPTNKLCQPTGHLPSLLWSILYAKNASLSLDRFCLGYGIISGLHGLAPVTASAHLLMCWASRMTAPIDKRWHRDTVAIAAGRPPHAETSPVNVPISVSSIYHHFSPARDYIREGSDIVAAFEAALGALDHGTAIAFSSGMAAVAAVAEGLPAGARIVMPITLYSGSAVLLTEQERLGKAEVIEVDLIDTDAVIEALGSHTDLLW